MTPQLKVGGLIFSTMGILIMINTALLMWLLAYC